MRSPPRTPRCTVKHDSNCRLDGGVTWTRAVHGVSPRLRLRLRWALAPRLTRATDRCGRRRNVDAVRRIARVH
jgi:hypothetical protein